MKTSAIDSEGTALEIAARRSSVRQWRAFVDALAAALATTVDDEATRDILAKTGAGVAEAHPIAPCPTLADLAAAINANLEHLEWGQIEIRETERALDIILAGYPYFETADGRAVFAAVFESLLDRWLAAQASRPDLAVRLARSTGGAYPALVFRYERSAPLEAR